MLSDSVVLYSLTACLAPGRLHARVILWVQSVRCLEDRYLTTCSWRPTKRRTRPSNKVSPLASLLTSDAAAFPRPPSYGLLTPFVEAAMDANAPIEDEEENVGEIDSDEETSNVMAALALWNPQPVVPPAVLQPIKRTYQLARLHEQLQMATNGGRTNIFKVVGFGAQRLPEGHPGLMDSDDAMGEPDTVMFPTSARASSFGLQGSMSRRPSVSSRG